MPSEIKWKSGPRPRGRQSLLLCGNGDECHQFEHKTIPGVLAIAKDDYVKNGKWSHTNYTLVLADGAWCLPLTQSFEEGQYFHGCRSVADVITEFRKAGCTATDEGIVKLMEDRMPQTLARIRKKEAELKSVQ